MNKQQFKSLGPEMRPGSQRPAFTLVELLVVVAIIGILVGLLLPAIQFAREAARRTSCTNNLKQIGLAIQNYHDAYKVLPPGYLAVFDTTGNENGPGWGWAALVLPYLEEGNLHRTIQFGLSIESPTNAGPRTTQITTYLCPSDSPEPIWIPTTYDLSGTPKQTICDVASANYIGVFGTTEPGVNGDGIFFRNGKLALRNITDGTSHTIAVGERSHRLCQATWVGAVSNANLYPPPGSSAPPVVDNSTGMILGHTGDGNGPGAADSHANQFSSMHGAGANFLFADGHVQFLDETIEYKTYMALSTRAGGEVIGEF
jgi:prepilin-type N-terminal cleavage/methylation domain-containing protein/prepilin-type processing-associated H-X9-DG protein